MKFIFLIAAFNAFFFSALLIQKKPKALHDNILIAWLIYLGAYIGVYSFYSHELFIHFHLLSITLLSLLMLHGPFLYCYTLILITGNRHIPGKYLLHFAPFITFNLYILIASLKPGISEKLNIEKLSAVNDPPVIFIFFLILTALSGIVYFLMTINLFKKLDIKIFNNFSNVSNIDPDWLRKLVLIFGILWTCLILITVVHHVFHMFPMVFCTDGLFLSLSLFVILIGYFGLKQKVIFTAETIISDENNSKVRSKYSGSRLDDSEVEQYSSRLVNHMESSKSYLNPELTLPQLAAELGIPVHLLSQVINANFRLNFFDFVNNYRVEAVKERIANPRYESFSLMGIAMDCGFNSKSAFNRVFKQISGLTPSKYKEAITHKSQATILHESGGHDL